MESSQHRRAYWNWKRVVIIGSVVIGFLLFLVPFVLASMIFQSMLPSIEQQQQGKQAGLDPQLMAIYQEIGTKYQIPWPLLAALHQLNMPALPTGKSASGQFEAEIQAASLRYGVDPALIKAIIQQESGWNPRSTSSAGARGLMQLMPENCRQNGLDPNTTCYNPYQNIMAGTREIASYLQKYKNNLALALAAYNAGPGNVDKYHGVPPFKETQQYVKNVPALYQQFKGGGVPLNLVAIRQQVESIAQNLAKLRDYVQQSPSTCNQQLKTHHSVFGTLSCALYAMKSDWSFVDQVEAAALSYGPDAANTFTTKMKSTGGILPWPCEGQVTSPFGRRWGRMHKGIDIGNSLGTPIYSVADGVVTVAKTDPGGFGFYVVIDHGGGISTLYGHMYPNTVKVQVGQQVKKGQMIAEMGSNGHSTGPHLHFEVHVNNNPVNPLSFLMKR